LLGLISMTCPNAVPTASRAGAGAGRDNTGLGAPPSSPKPL
jgi:hypothetical protein